MNENQPVKIILEVEGMMCGMCESHVNTTLRKAFEGSKVSSSHRKGQTIIETTKDVSDAEIRKAMEPTGYRVLSIKREKAEKSRGISGFFRR